MVKQKEALCDLSEISASGENWQEHDDITKEADRDSRFFYKISISTLINSKTPATVVQTDVRITVDYRYVKLK